jgi:uncharacterized membrane protein
MVLMALDHANYFIAQQHSQGEHWGGTFPSYQDIWIFLARLATHPAAPGFAFLMGVGITLFARNRREQGWGEWDISRHFLVRGGLLVALQLLVVNWAWKLGPEPFPSLYIGVLFALGGGMMIGSALLQLKAGPLLVLSAALFIGIELTHPDPAQWGAIFDQPLGLIFGYSGGDMDFWSNYPILPWLELVTFGMAFGTWLSVDSDAAYRRGVILGSIFILSFVVLRSLDGFGNIRPREGQGWIAFLNVVKYPPAMTFTLLTMGLNLLLLGGLAKADARAQKLLGPLVVFGRTPLFFYLLHLYLYGFLGRWLASNGTSLLVMLPYWILGLLILYPLCKWYCRFKSRQPAGSVWRFL